MKKLFLATAALAAMISVSCVAEKPIANDGEKVSITVKLAGANGTTRADEAAADPAQAPSITGGYIYVLDNNTVLKAEAIPSGASTVTIDGGNKVYPQSASVYVIANVPANVSGASSFGSMTDIQNAVSAISYAGAGINTDYETPAMANVGGAVPVGTPDGNMNTTVSVNISPLFARVEIKGLEGGTDAQGQTWIKSFKLANVYLDNYYSSFSMTGAGSDLHFAGTNTTTLSGQFGDPVTMAAAANTIAPTNGVWAYHVGPGSLVHVVFKLSEFTAWDEVSGAPSSTADSTISTPTYLTVDSYSQSITSFERGKIYTINPVKFSLRGQATSQPNPTTVGITATITVTNWDPVGLDGVVATPVTTP